MSEPVRVQLDTSALAPSLGVLAELAQRFPKLVQAIVGLPETRAKLFRVDVDRAAAADAHEVRAVLQPSEFYVYLVAALRALDGERGVVEVAGHP